MFSPLNLLSSLEHPVLCPALLENQPCPIPRCLFSHDVKPAPPPPPTPPPIAAAPSSTDSPVPPPLTVSERRMRDIVEGKKKQNVPALKRAARPLDQGGATNPPLNDRPMSEERAVRPLDQGGATNPLLNDRPMSGERIASPAASNEGSDLAPLSIWPAPAQSVGKKGPEPVESDVAQVEFPESQILQSSKAKTANNAATTSTMKPAMRSLKRPAPESPSTSSSPKTDPLKRPKTSTAMSATKAVTKNPAGATLNPRLIKRSPAQHGTRLRYLTLLYTEIMRLSGDPKGDADIQKIIEKCLDLEEDVATKKRDIYRSAMSNLCGRYKRASPKDYKKELEEEKAKAAPAPAAPRVSKGLDNTKPSLDTGLPKATEVKRLREIIVHVEALKEHGYVLTPPTEADMVQARNGLEAASGWEQCERCNQRFQVFPDRRISDGALTTNGPCIYHHGRKFSARALPGAVSEQKWTCCSAVVGFSFGCETAPSHVFKVSDPKRLALDLQFTPTPPNPKVKDDRALAVDCEMSFTTLGMELVRLTATAFPSGQTVIDGLVKPYGVVLDWNTRFSGVTADMLNEASPWQPSDPYPKTTTAELINPTLSAPSQLQGFFKSPEHARRALYHYINPDTVLIGHALENDLLHLRMCHLCVVDTAVLFPHPRGLPMRNKLKFVVEKYLKREIQVEGGDAGLRGHDSAVDARCAAELVRLRIREREERGV